MCALRIDQSWAQCVYLVHLDLNSQLTGIEMDLQLRLTRHSAQCPPCATPSHSTTVASHPQGVFLLISVFRTLLSSSNCTFAVSSYCHCTSRFDRFQTAVSRVCSRCCRCVDFILFHIQPNTILTYKHIHVWSVYTYTRTYTFANLQVQTKTIVSFTHVFFKMQSSQ